MKSLLKFITCGSVDDGKSTLIGHMLYDAKLLFADQERALELDSKVGSCEGAIDYSLLLDGLMAEREQGITIDVAYRYFTTERRSFIVADTPGHEEYTRNMAVGASFADLSIILVDATQGVLIQTKRHTRICSLMGIKNFVFAINKMDLVHYDKVVFDKIKKEIKRLISEYDVDSIKIIPVSATIGDNVTNQSDHMTWYQSDTLLYYLENIEIEDEVAEEGFILPVQRVSRPNHTFRGFQGEIEAGSISAGDDITALPSREKARVKSISIMDKEASCAVRGQSVTIQLDKEVDVSRGCVLTSGNNLHVNNMFSTVILWMDDIELIAGKGYYIKVGTKMLPATIMNIKYKVDINTGDHIPADRIYKNEITACDISTTDKLVYDEFKKNKAMGGLILIDKITNMTSACGVIEHPLRRSDNLVWQKMDITKEYRANQKSQSPLTLWFTGLSGSGKSTLANEVEKRLFAMGKHTMLLDGDNVRLGLNSNLGFKEADRIENIRRVAEVAKLMNDAGLIVLAALISPYERDRENAREIVGEGFVEIYVSTPLEKCESRDIKGLYKKARNGEIPNFTGVYSPYEIPIKPDIIMDTSNENIEECVQILMEQLERYL